MKYCSFFYYFSIIIVKIIKLTHFEIVFLIHNNTINLIKFYFYQNVIISSKYCSENSSKNVFYMIIIQIGTNSTTIVTTVASN